MWWGGRVPVRPLSPRRGAHRLVSRRESCGVNDYWDYWISQVRSAMADEFWRLLSVVFEPVDVMVHAMR